MKVCLFTVSFGEEYNLMAKNLAASIIKNGADFSFDLVVISDSEVEGWTRYVKKSAEEIKKSLLFEMPFSYKFFYLNDIVNKSDADYFIYLDVDSICINRLKKSSFFKYDVFVPRDRCLNTIRDIGWHGILCGDIVDLGKKINIEPEWIFNCNAGFWGFSRKYFGEFYKHLNNTCKLFSLKLPGGTEELVLSMVNAICNREKCCLMPNLYDNEFATLNVWAKNVDDLSSNMFIKEWFGDIVYNATGVSIVHTPQLKNALSVVRTPQLKNALIVDKNIKLHILTATIRPQHIRRLSKDILDSNIQKYFDITWAVCFDLDKSQVPESLISYINNLPYKTEIKFIKDSRNKSGGNYAKDIYIKLVPDDVWIWQYDDDNTIHEKYPKVISEYINSHKNSNLIAYWQQDRYTPKKIEDLRCGVTDTAMYTFRAKIGKIAEYPYIYGGDGLFLENLVIANGGYADIIQDVLCKYNTNAHQNSLSEINENKNSSKNAEKIKHKITRNKTAQALIDKSAKNHGKVKDFAIKLSNKMHPTQRVILNVEGSGKAHVPGHLDMTWRPVGKNRMSLFHTKNKSKIGEIIKNPSTGEYLVVLDVFGKTSSTAWIGKEI